MSSTTIGWSLAGWLFGERDEASPRSNTVASPKSVQAARVDSHLHEASASRLDADLTIALRDGNEAAFERWYRAHYTNIWRFAKSIVISPDGASEIVQDVLASLWIKRATVAIRTTGTAYVYGAIRQRAMREYRHHAVVWRTEQVATLSGEMLGMSAESPPVDVRLVEEERAAQLAHGISALPDRQREALLLWLEYGMSTPEVAEILGVSDRAVRKLLEKARSHLRALLHLADEDRQT